MNVNDMKKWLVSYSIRYKSGTINEKEMTIRAETIQKALIGALKILENGSKHREVEQVVIWDVGIINEDVF